MQAGAAIYALGFNYADHSKELGFGTKQATPLVFLKGGNSFVGHGGETTRPSDANQMHPECELVAVIGSPARKVSRADAFRHVSGYTAANDYAIREYLEDFYRPNARVKNRDATTPIGPWIIDAADVEDPQALSLSMRVNGIEVQRGSTADMILDVAGLIEYLSSFATLMPGDMILTGTPHGVHFVAAGDEVVCEIEGIWRLANRVGVTTRQRVLRTRRETLVNAAGRHAARSDDGVQRAKLALLGRLSTFHRRRAGGEPDACGLA